MYVLILNLRSFPKEFVLFVQSGYFVIFDELLPAEKKFKPILLEAVYINTLFNHLLDDFKINIIIYA